MDKDTSVAKNEDTLLFHPRWCMSSTQVSWLVWKTWIERWHMVIMIHDRMKTLMKITSEWQNSWYLPFRIAKNSFFLPAEQEINRDNSFPSPQILSGPFLIKIFRAVFLYQWLLLTSLRRVATKPTQTKQQRESFFRAKYFKAFTYLHWLIHVQVHAIERGKDGFWKWPRHQCLPQLCWVSQIKSLSLVLDTSDLARW